jgi:hypothetical protein
MFELPLDPPEAFDLPDGKEEWIAEKAMEVRADPKLMYAALEWDGEQSGSEDVYDNLSQWVASYQFFDHEGRIGANSCLLSVCAELAERYAEYVLLPAHIQKMKNGDYCG